MLRLCGVLAWCHQDGFRARGCVGAQVPATSATPAAASCSPGAAAVQHLPQSPPHCHYLQPMDKKNSENILGRLILHIL